MGYTWTWASLGFPTGLVRMELRNRSTLEGRAGAARDGHENTLQAQTIVACDRGACWGAYYVLGV